MTCRLPILFLTVGGQESANFLQWFSKLFVAAVMPMTVTASVVLFFFDGHHSHISLKLIEVARSDNIHLVCFLPRHPPLDVWTVKIQWCKFLRPYHIESHASTMTKEEFPRMRNLFYLNTLEVDFVNVDFTL